MQQQQQFFEWPDTCIITGFTTNPDPPIERKLVYGKLSIRKTEAAKQNAHDDSPEKHKMGKYEKAFKRSIRDHDKKIKTYCPTDTETVALKN